MRSGTQVEAQDDEAVSRVLRIVPGPHRGQRTWVVIAMFVSSFAVAEFSARPASAQQVEGSLWETDGAVLAMVLDNNILYVGGTFSCVGPHTGAGALLDTMAGGPLAGFPRVEGGSVYAVAADGSGGWYIGGSFTSVGGVPRNCVAQVLSDNTVSAWNPNADDRVCSLAVSGNTVYAGGRFTNIGWQPRSKIAALDATTGRARLMWNPSVTGTIFDFPYVNAIAVSQNTVYVGGNFATVGGQTRNYVAALDATTGIVSAWDPNVNGEVFALSVSGNSVYVGGSFNAIGDSSRHGIAAVDAATGLASPWNPGANGAVYALATSGNVIYAGGSFTSIGDSVRCRLAALDLASGEVTGWSANANSNVLAVQVSGAAVYAAGSFTNIAGVQRHRIAAVDAVTGHAKAWNPTANGAVNALGASGAVVYAGGEFSSIGGMARSRLAALELATGQLTTWNPGADGDVLALAVSGDVVYAGGAFDGAGGAARASIAALDSQSGAATAWDPRAAGLYTFSDPRVYALAVSGNTVFAGGSFDSIGGCARRGIAEIRSSTGKATAWDPGPALAGSQPEVHTLALSGNLVYVGGDFSSIGDSARSAFASLDAASGHATGWNPDFGGQSPRPAGHVLTLSGNTSYVGGAFDSVGASARKSVAAVDATTGAATAWNPNAQGYAGRADIRCIASSRGAVHVGGDFVAIGDSTRNSVAALDAITGKALAWDARANGSVRALALAANTVYAGGYFTSVGGESRRGLVALSVPVTASAPEVPASAATGIALRLAPNPVRGSADVLFTLPRAETLSLQVLDLQGRQVRSLLRNAELGAGAQRVTVDTGGLAPGVYHLVLRTAGQLTSRRFVVLE